MRDFCAKFFGLGSPGARFLRLLLWAGVLLPSLAEAVTIRAYVEPAKVRANQQIHYVITVQDGNVQSLPTLQLPLQITQLDGPQTSQRMVITGNQRQAFLHLAWVIMPTEPGEFVIPPQTLMVDGQPLATNEVKLTVENGGAEFQQAKNKPILQIELAKTEAYQGEVVPVSVSVYVPRTVQVRRFGMAEMTKSDMAIARFPQVGEQTSTMIDGVVYYVVTFRSTLSSLRTGELKVGPAKMELLAEVPVEDDGSRQRGMFPPGFGQNFPPGFFPGMSEPVKLELLSPQVTMKVLPLPEEGRPVDFSGAVGDFQMTATASPTELTVGDPIAVEIAVSGAGNFDALKTPALVTDGGWKSYPPKRYVIEGPLDQNQTPTLERKIGYSQVLIPEAVHPHVPPFEVNFFSPAQKQYVTLRTEPIPLVMKPAPAVGESAGGVSTGTVTEVVAPPVVADPQADITDILMQPPARSHWLAGGSSLLLHSRLFWSVQAAPVGVFALACLLAAARRRRAERMAGRAGALRAAWEKYESTGGSPGSGDEDFLHAAAQFIQEVHGSGHLSGPLQSIVEKYETMNFAAAKTGRLEPAARQEMQRTLSALLRQSLSKVSTLLLVGVLLAGGAPISGLLAAEAETTAAPKAVAATPDDVYHDAVAELEKGNYARAQYLAESLTKKEPPQLSAEVFQIIGHARYKQGDLGRAALWYQRAMLLDGRNAELKQNLRHIFERTRYLSFIESSPLRLASVWLTTNEWLLLASGGVWLGLLALTWRVFRPSGLAVLCCIVGFMVALPAGVFAGLRPLGPERVKDVSIVTQPEVNSYTAATVTSGSVISLPPGTQVRTLEKRGSWFYVEIPNKPESLRGWVESSAITPLWVWDAAMVP